MQVSLAKAQVDGVTLAVAAIAHEFGHLEDASNRPAFFQMLQEQNDLAKKLNKDLGAEFGSDPRYVEKNQAVLKAGGYSNDNQMTIDMDRRAEREVMPVVQGRLSERTLKSVNKAVDKLLNPKRKG